MGGRSSTVSYLFRICYCSSSTNGVVASIYEDARSINYLFIAKVNQWRLVTIKLPPPPSGALLDQISSFCCQTANQKYKNQNQTKSTLQHHQCSVIYISMVTIWLMWIIELQNFRPKCHSSNNAVIIPTVTQS